MREGSVVAVTANAVVVRRLADVARAAGATFASFDHPARVEVDGDPRAVVVDLEIPGALEACGDFRARWPGALLAGFVSRPDRERWEAAEEAGYDLVATRGTIGARVAGALETWMGPPRERLLRVLDAADAAGRVGLVVRLPDTPAGSLALYQIGGRLYATGDLCPHAGATLSEGDLAGAVVTCPRHGSQFDVRSGVRLRGPADDGIPTYEVVVEGGAVFLKVGGQSPGR